MRLLAIDIGNSRIKCALFQESEIERTFHMASDPLASGAAYRHALRAHLSDLMPQRTVISSVVPELNDRIGEAVQREFMLLPEFIRAADLEGDLVTYDPPSSLGADRIAAAMAGYNLYGSAGGERRPVIVVDAGTAVTFEVVSAAGRYLGGAIWAGPRLVASSLRSGTSLLPEIDPVLPKKILGTDTETSLRVGILYGFLDGVSGILARLTAKAGPDVYTVSTGGYGDWLAQRVVAIQSNDPDLVVQGIRFIAIGQIPKG